MYEVLIAEDDPMVAMINRSYVEENPTFHVAAVCGDGQSALEYIGRNKIDLVILDVYMPIMDGLQVIRSIRERKINVSVIMVTAANDTPAVQEALSLGAVDYLVKPFSGKRFSQALETFLRREGVFSEVKCFSQQNIDALLGDRNSAAVSGELPKGIQEQTFRKMCEFIESSSKEYTGEEIADEIGLSRVTVRRYMNYLLEIGMITERMNYETGGRPAMVYKRKA